MNGNELENEWSGKSQRFSALFLCRFRQRRAREKGGRTIALACAACSAYKEQVQPLNSDDQTRIGPILQAYVQSIDAQLTPAKGIIVVTAKNNTIGTYISSISFRVEIIDPSSGAIIADVTQNHGASFLSGGTISEQFNLGFFKQLTLGKSYQVRGTFSYHGSNTAKYPINSAISTVSVTVVPRL